MLLGAAPATFCPCTSAVEPCHALFWLLFPCRLALAFCLRNPSSASSLALGAAPGVFAFASDVEPCHAMLCIVLVRSYILLAQSLERLILAARCCTCHLLPLHLSAVEPCHALPAVFFQVRPCTLPAQSLERLILAFGAAPAIFASATPLLNLVVLARRLYISLQARSCSLPAQCPERIIGAARCCTCTIYC